MDTGWHPNLWHPTTQVATADPPLRVQRGQGALLELEDGRTLIDAISSWWVTLHGHGEPTIAAAIALQATALEQVIFANFRHLPAERLAERLSAHTGLQRVFFSDNGSTAVEVALKVAWQWWRNQGEPRAQLIAFEGAYHGDTVGAMALGERSLFSAPFEPLLFSVARAPWPATWWGDDGVEEREASALAQLEALLETPTAAVILEPLIQGASGMRQVRPAFLLEVERRVRQAGALLIADEVLTGFGRTGTTDPALTLFHGHSFTANPLGCAAALASLDLLVQRPELYQGMEARHRPLLKALARDPKVHKPRLLGTMAAFDLVSPNVNGPEGYLHPIGRHLQRLVRAEGVFLRPLGQVVYLLPPLCISDAELQRCYDALATALGTL
jgi:adenosylmethionine-8-amino-7-oxononanoate aminotransferase